MEDLFFRKYEKIGLRYNPFLPAPLTEDDVEKLMVGREKELDACYKAIADKCNVLIYGLKGVGKTTLLNYLKVKAKKQKLLISYLTMPKSLRKFLIALLSGLIKENPEPNNMDVTIYHKIIRDLDQYSSVPGALPTITLEKYINKYIDMFDYDLPILVFIDEIHSVAEGKPDPFYISYLCNLFFEKKFIFVACGLTTFYKSSEPNISALRDRFPDEVPLKPLREDEIKEIILKRIEMACIEENSFTLPEEILNLVAEYSHGNPRLAILLCRDIVNKIAEGGTINKKLFTEVAEKHHLLYSQRLLDGLGQKTREIYALILQYNPATPTSLSRITGYSPQSIQYHINILHSYGLIEKMGGSGRRPKYIPSEVI